MKKTIVSALIVGIFLLYCFVHAQDNPVALVPTTPTPGSRSSSSSTSTPSATATSGTTPTPTSTSASLYNNGTYTGSEADAQWGIVQVQAVIENDKIISIQFLQYPDERNRSVQINNYADPQLVSEALEAQSADVDIVSGATDTSEAFMQSLSEALIQAKA